MQYSKEFLKLEKHSCK